MALMEKSHKKRVPRQMAPEKEADDHNLIQLPLDCCPTELVREPAWRDDDEEISVGAVLKAQKRKLPKGGIHRRNRLYADLLKDKFTRLVGNPSWAQLGEKRTAQDSDSDDELLQSSGFKKRISTSYLPADMIELKKLTDLNRYNEGPFINCIEFHPTSTVALVAGNSGIVNLYAVDGKNNHKLHSVTFKQFPILSGAFIHGGNEAIFGSNCGHLYSYDLIASKPQRVPLPSKLTQCKNITLSPDGRFLAVPGKWGEVHILCSTTKERVALYKQDEEVTALCYSPHGNLLFGHGASGEVTIWDVNMGRVKHKFTDEGCLQGSSITVSPSGQFLATGSHQGVVNLYNADAVLNTKVPKPDKTIFNLTTAVKQVKFNASSDILALSSSHIRNSIKLLHLGSKTVFRNFPTFKSNLGYINTIQFSPNSGYLAVGNSKNLVSLFRLKYYGKY